MKRSNSKTTPLIYRTDRDIHSSMQLLSNTKMSGIPSYQVYGKKKLDEPILRKPNKKRLKIRKFRESELKQLDEVLHANDIDIKGNFNQIYSCIKAWFFYF